MKTSSEFWDNTSVKYSKKAVPSQKIYEEKLKRTQSLLTKDSRVMEIGCGTGTTSLIHAPFVKSIEAYDYSKSMIEIAEEKKANKRIENVSFKVKAAKEISFKSESYDLIMAHSLLHLTHNNKELLTNIYKALRPGGYFVSSTGCVKEMNFLIRKIIPLMTFLGKAPFVGQFSSDELIKLHKDIGFKIIDPWRYKKGELFLIVQK